MNACYQFNPIQQMFLKLETFNTLTETIAREYYRKLALSSKPNTVCKRHPLLYPPHTLSLSLSLLISMTTVKCEPVK